MEVSYYDLTMTSKMTKRIEAMYVKKGTVRTCTVAAGLTDDQAEQVANGLGISFNKKIVNEQLGTYVHIFDDQHELERIYEILGLPIAVAVAAE